MCADYVYGHVYVGKYILLMKMNDILGLYKGMKKDVREFYVQGFIGLSPIEGRCKKGVRINEMDLKVVSIIQI